MNPSSAWDVIKAQIRQEMPKAAFDSWVETAHFVAFEDGTFIIGVANDFARDWLESRLYSTVFRQLTGIMNQAIEVKFIVIDHTVDDNESGDLPEEEFPIDFVQVQGIKQAYTQPYSVHVMPAYLLRWIPYIGTDEFFTLIGFRQAFYLAQNRPSQNGDKCRVSIRHVARIIGRSNSLVLRHRDSGSLDWFIKVKRSKEYKTENGQVQQIAQRYTMLAVAPPTPHDQEILSEWLLENKLDKSPISALEAFLNTPLKKILPFFPKVPKRLLTTKPSNSPQTFRALIFSMCHLEKMSEEHIAKINKLADQAEEHLVNGFGLSMIPLYFLQSWVPNLRGTLASLIIVLRQLAFEDTKTGEIRERVYLPEGRKSLAKYLGKSDQTLQKYIQLRNGNAYKKENISAATGQTRQQVKARRELAALFIYKILQKRGHPGLWFYIRKQDPLIPEHEKDYESVVQFISFLSKRYGRSIDEETINRILLTAAAVGLISVENQASEKESNEKILFAPDRNNEFAPDGNKIFALDKNIEFAPSSNEDFALIKDKGFAPPAIIRTAPIEGIDSALFEDMVIRAEQKQLNYIKYLSVKALRELLLQTLITDSTTTPKSHRVTENSPYELDWCVNESSRWDSKQIIKNLRLSNKQETLLLERYIDPHNLVSLVLYLYSPKGESINVPERFIYKKLIEEPNYAARGRTLSLAKLGPLAVAELIKKTRKSSGEGEIKNWIEPPEKKLWDSVMKGKNDIYGLFEMAELLGLAKQR